MGCAMAPDGTAAAIVGGVTRCFAATAAGGIVRWFAPIDEAPGSGAPMNAILAFLRSLLDDSRVAHGVTTIEPLDPHRAAYRDVLVVTWRRNRDAIESP